ncbi:hypothetical protein G6011_09410 [Alternaria panax]|uniref:Uncharacterized protein n=1 Tax=Alternaria panax TaxID=48097 RepID=A0AAD4IB00_9PLEO|nr:hypothetical protein G6011_09410 [Alternaria panax]
MASNLIRQAFEKILSDQENRKLPVLANEDYTPFLAAISAVLINPVFMYEHTWQMQTLEQCISRPAFNAKVKDDCDNKLDIRLEVGEELDSSGKVVFIGNVVRITVDEYVLAKGRSTTWAADALLLAFQKVVALAREYSE